MSLLRLNEQIEKKKEMRANDTFEARLAHVQNTSTKLENNATVSSRWKIYGTSSGDESDGSGQSNLLLDTML